MSGEQDPAAAAIDDARAFIDSLLRSDWQELHIASGDFELFIAREGGGPNPMFGGDQLADEPVPAPPVVAALQVLTAPHVATVEWLAPAGSSVAKGEVAARLSVLDQDIELKAEHAGRIVSVEAEAGDLVEFGAPLLQLAQGA